MGARCNIRATIFAREVARKFSKTVPSRVRHSLLNSCGLFIGLLSAAALHGQVTFYSGPSAHTDWLSAAGGTPIVLDFEGYADGTNSNTGALAAQAAAAGVVFRPFLNGSSYP